MPTILPGEDRDGYRLPPIWSGLVCPSCGACSPPARESFSTPGLWYADCGQCGHFWRPEQKEE